MKTEVGMPEVSGLKDKAGDKVTSMVGDMAGAVADPKSGWAQAKSRLSSPTLIAGVAAVAVAYLLGRHASRH
jgi:hypothetical protein